MSEQLAPDDGRAEFTPASLEAIYAKLGYAKTPEMIALISQIQASPAEAGTPPENDPARELIINYMERAQGVVDDIQAAGTSQSGMRDEVVGSVLAIAEMYKASGRQQLYSESLFDLIYVLWQHNRKDIIDELVAMGMIEGATVDRALLEATPQEELEGQAHAIADYVFDFPEALDTDRVVPIDDVALEDGPPWPFIHTEEEAEAFHEALMTAIFDRTGLDRNNLTPHRTYQGLVEAGGLEQFHHYANVTVYEFNLDEYPNPLYLHHVEPYHPNSEITEQLIPDSWAVGADVDIGEHLPE